jgi:tetratricopeptide (TPR) repeat protein
VALDPLNTLAMSGLANAYFALGLYEEARKHLFRMQALFSDLGITYRYLSFIEYQTGHLDKSIFWMNKSIAVEPDPLLFFIAISSYIMVGWADEALAAAESYKQSSDGIDISRLVQAQLDNDFNSIASESTVVYKQTGESVFAVLAAWAEAAAGNCSSSISILQQQYPSLKGEIIEYMDGEDLLDAVLLAHCNAETGNSTESRRLTRALLDSNLLSGSALVASPARRLVRIAALAVAGDKSTALSELSTIDITTMPVAISKMGLPIDELPVFEALFDEIVFRNYATQERYQISQQARLLASGETERQVIAQVAAAGYAIQR